MIVSSMLYRVVNCAEENENEGRAEKSIQCGLENLCSAQARLRVSDDYCYVLRGRDDLVYLLISKAGYPALKAVHHGLLVR